MIPRSPCKRPLGALGAAVVGLIWQESGSLNPAFYLMAGVACLMAALVLAFLRQSPAEAGSAKLQSRICHLNR